MKAQRFLNREKPAIQFASQPTNNGFSKRSPQQKENFLIMARVDSIHATCVASSIPVATDLGQEQLTFRAWQASYSGTHPDAKPALIARPQTAEHVATIISALVDSDLDVVVRGGGHDVFGRFTAQDAVCVDLHDLRAVAVSEDKLTVRVSGGATTFDVVRVVEAAGLQIPTGSCGLVGHVGWSIVGGFGPYTHTYGLGVDQIVGARVVTAQGKLVAADERMLKGIRGGGGNFGVIVELTLKVYPKTEVHACMIMYDSTDITETVTTFFNNYSALFAGSPLPTELYLLPSFWNFPHIGPTMACSYIWTGPASETSKAWLDRATALAPLHTKAPPPNIVPTTSLGYLEALGKKIPLSVMGRSQGTAIERWTPDVIASFATVASRMPLTSTAAFHVHTLRPECPSLLPSAPPSVCPYRQPSILVDLLGLAATDIAAEDSSKWALEGRDLMMSANGAGKKAYLAQTSPERTDLRGLYGDMLDELVELKEEFDPKGMFCFAVPALSSKRRDPAQGSNVAGTKATIRV